MREEDRATLINNALNLMGSTPQAQLTKARMWDSAFACLKAKARQVDSIADEMLAAIKQGKAHLEADPKLKRTCRPGRLLFNAFPYKPQLPYSEAKFAVLLGRHIMRDKVALGLRPAYGRPSLVPQLMPTLADAEEGGGKSSFCRVMGGGSVGDGGDAGRYTDAISIAMIVGSPNHGHHTLAALCAGKTAVELADKNLGMLNETQGNVIKNFVNSGVMRWRRMNKDAFHTINWRALKFVTTNLQAVLTPWLGIRRLPVLDLERWRERRTTGPEIIRPNHNTGLNWLATHLDVVTTLAFRAGDWRNETLAPSDALRKLMYARADDHTRLENWQFILDGWLRSLEMIVAVDHPDYVFGLPSSSMAEWANSQLKGRQPSPTAMGTHLGERGWVKLDRRIHGARRGKNERMRVFEGAAAKAARESRGDKAQILLTHVLIYEPGSDFCPAAFELKPVKKYDSPPDLKVVANKEKSDRSAEDTPF